MTSSRIKQPDGGLRVRIGGGLGRRVGLAIPVDIGFGDVITLGRRREAYPTVLNLSASRLWTYQRETMTPQTCGAMASAGDRNSPVKDLCDAARFGFDGHTLRTVTAETFHCGTSPADGRPTALRTGYPDDREARAGGQHWRALRRRIGTDINGPDRLDEAGEELWGLLGPICDSWKEEGPFTPAWPARGLWRPGVQERVGGEGGG